MAEKDTTEYTEAQLKKKTAPDLLKIAFGRGIDTSDGPQKAATIERILDDQSTWNDEEEPLEEELEDELDEELDDEAEEEVELSDELDEEEEDDLVLPEDDEEDEIEEPAKPAKAKKTPAKKSTAAKPEKNGDTLAAKQVAFELGTEAKTLRQFLRSDASTTEAVGSGGRYEFDKSDLPKIKQEFEAWKSAHASRGSKRGTGKAKAPEPVEEIEEVESIEELDEAELDDEIEDEDLELDEEEDA